MTSLSPNFSLPPSYSHSLPPTLSFPSPLEAIRRPQRLPPTAPQPWGVPIPSPARLLLSAPQTFAAVPHRTHRSLPPLPLAPPPPMPGVAAGGPKPPASAGRLVRRCREPPTAGATGRRAGAEGPSESAPRPSGSASGCHQPGAEELSGRIPSGERRVVSLFHLSSPSKLIP